jgi:hypothetical protein
LSIRAMAAETNDEAKDEKFSSSRFEAVPPAHVQDAWRSWLSALATDAEAATAASMAYESLPPEGRDAWLDALASDSEALDVPALALYAPLLAVEPDGPRRMRIEAAIASDANACPPATTGPHALRGVGSDGTHACVLVAPLYLDFVQVLVCRYSPAKGVVTAKHQPLRNMGDLAPVVEVDGIAVEPTPLRVVIEELAHAILADRREHRESPPALASFAHLFAPDLEDSEDAPSRG